MQTMAPAINPPPPDLARRPMMPAIARTTASPINGQNSGTRVLSKASICWSTSGRSTISERPSVSTSTRPRTAVSVPRVTMKALIPTNWTMTPLTIPTPIAVVIAASAASGKPMPGASPISTAAASAATEATDRSNAPVISITVIATPMMPTSDA